MCNITLICTVHEEKGICNLPELYRIMENIAPEIIFEEIPPSFFDQYYLDKTRTNLETNTINKYLERHQIVHIPVDYFDISKTFFKDIGFMLNKVESKSHDYCKLIDTHVLYVKLYGFKYLNSNYCNDIHVQLYDAIDKTLQVLGDEKLYQTFKTWVSVIGKREDEMLKNIYSYSKEHNYNRGLFFIGAAHRESIIKKIQISNDKEITKLNWNYSEYDTIM